MAEDFGEEITTDEFEDVVDNGEEITTDEYEFEDVVEDGEKKENKTWLIVGIVLIVLCCCCAIIAGGLWALWANGDAWFDLAFQMTNLLL
jgi:hypothetical protein